MPLSRVRVRLAAWFALAFLAGLAVLDLSLYWYLRSQADQRLTRDLASVAAQVIVACRREYAEAPEDGMGKAAENALAEWQVGTTARGVRSRWTPRRDGWAAAPHPLRAAAEPERRARRPDRRRHVRTALRRHSDGQPAFAVLVVGSTERLSEDNEALAWWLAVSSPIVAVLALCAGYLMSARALRPIGDLDRAVAAVLPGQLSLRRPMPPSDDEIGRLAARIDDLLERLERSQSQGRAFLRRAAHQIRTPLTLVVGESELSLERERDVAGYQAALGRVHRAAGQMQRRVNELFLLAQAQAGEQIALDAAVDLDGLALDATDLMRERAQSLGRRLRIDRSTALTVRGSARGRMRRWSSSWRTPVDTARAEPR